VKECDESRALGPADLSFKQVRRIRLLCDSKPRQTFLSFSKKEDVRRRRDY